MITHQHFNQDSRALKNGYPQNLGIRNCLNCGISLEDCRLGHNQACLLFFIMSDVVVNLVWDRFKFTEVFHGRTNGILINNILVKKQNTISCVNVFLGFFNFFNNWQTENGEVILSQ